MKQASGSSLNWGQQMRDYSKASLMYYKKKITNR